MEIFITGGSGFLGKRLIKKLQAEGYSITALSRSPSSDSEFEKLNIKTVRGSLSDISNWSGQLKGKDVVIHAASPIDVWGDWDELRHDIAIATEQLYQESDRNQVGRFIYLSSESVLQDKDALLDIDERFPYPDEPNSYYGKAKKLAEQALLNSSLNTECIVLRPTFIWGKGSPQLPNLVDKVKSGQFKWVDQGRAMMEMVHVENVVEAVRLALTAGQTKQVYFVTDDNPMPAKQFLSAFVGAMGTIIPNGSIPSKMAYPLSYAVEFIWRVLKLKKAPPISRFQLDFISLPRRYNINKIKSDLGYRPVCSFEQGINEMTDMSDA